ncbi:MAG TPA: hypothetical protein VFP80_04150 [Thermoanaerobaculia bacterium]|nr:hypothetical protein [Thermoanaerobaculia bacterium]
MRAVAFLLLFLSLAAPAFAQSGVGIEVDEVIDNRMSAGVLVGSLDLRVKLKGTGLDKATAARVLVKEARDDKGNALSTERLNDDFAPREYNAGMLQFSVGTPARAASSVTLKGTVELFVPGRDPNASIKVDKALAKLDAPLSHAKLKSAKLTLTPLSADGHAAWMKKHKLDEAKIEQIRAEGKKRGVDEKEIEMAIEMAKAFDGMDSALPEGTVILSGSKADFDRLFRVEVLGADGQPIDVGSRSTSTRGDDAVMTLQPSAPLPANAALQLYVITAKAKMSFPFELKVELP